MKMFFRLSPCFRFYILLFSGVVLTSGANAAPTRIDQLNLADSALLQSVDKESNISLKAFRAALAMGADPNLVFIDYSNNKRPLAHFIIQNAMGPSKKRAVELTEILRELIHTPNYDINVTDFRGDTPLTLALQSKTARSQATPVLNEMIHLIWYAPQVDRTKLGANNLSPFDYAVLNNWTDFIFDFIQFKNPNASLAKVIQANWKATPFEYFASYCNFSVMRLILENRTDEILTETKNNAVYSVFNSSDSRIQSSYITETIPEAQAYLSNLDELNVYPEEPSTISFIEENAIRVYTAAHRNAACKQTLDLLLTQPRLDLNQEKNFLIYLASRSPDARFKGGIGENVTPLMFAAYDGNLTLIKMLLQYKLGTPVDIHKKSTTSGLTALDFAKDGKQTLCYLIHHESEGYYHFTAKEKVERTKRCEANFDAIIGLVK